MYCSSSINRIVALGPIICLLFSGCGKRTPQTTLLSSDTIDLGDYRWKSRIVFVFAESGEIPAYRAFMDAWAGAQEGIKDRDLLIFQILDVGTSRGPRGPLSPRQEEDLRASFATTGEPFQIVLIGKDGGVKLRSPDASLTQIFELIDSMPMRRAEMREQESQRDE